MTLPSNKRNRRPPEPPCPNMMDHTDGPDGYLQWHDWARRMSKNHRQSKCAGCGLYKIWTPRQKATGVEPRGKATPSPETKR